MSSFYQKFKRAEMRVERFHGALGKSPMRARAYFGALRDLLNLYSSPENLSMGAETPQLHFSPLVAGLISIQFAYLAKGVIPGPVRDCKSVGTPSAGPMEEYDKEIGAAYVHAASSGQLADKHAVRTVSAEFGVVRSTVMLWKRTYPLKLKLSPEALTSMMKSSGLRYRERGRSAANILARDDRQAK